jgi:SEC-C motif
MAKVGRNDPCPCGSGKKYKKCCLETERQRTQPTVAPRGNARSAVQTVVTELDDLSNRVVDLIAARELDAAEAACRQLRAQYPDQVDGTWRLATVCEARGDRAAAARYYRDAAEFMRSRDGFDEASMAHMLESAERMEAEQVAPHEPPPAAPVRSVTEFMKLDLQSGAPADGGGR